MSSIYVDREEASKILKVSTRTIDRYVRRFRFKVRKDGRRVLIRRNDVDQIINQHLGRFMPEASASSGLTVKDIKVESVKKEGETPAPAREGVFEQLYGELRKEIKEKQERLEAATYRVGQLETQLKNMVPLLEYNRKEKALQEAQFTLEQKAIESERSLHRVEQKLRTERVAKWVYLSLVGLLLVAEPLMLFFWAFS